MKKTILILIASIIILCISAINLFADNDKDENEFQAYCCKFVEVTSEQAVDDPCCMKISVYNPHCQDLVIKIDKKLNNDTIDVTKEKVNKGEKKEFTVCGDIGESTIEVFVYLLDEYGNRYCTGDTFHKFTQDVKCCKCPDNIDDIIKIDLIVDGCDKGCKVKHKLILPEKYQKCFNEIKFNSSKDTSEQKVTITEAKNVIDKIEKCLKDHEEYKFNIVLIGINGEECQFNKTLYCKGKKPDIRKLCTPDCPEVSWGPSIKAEIENEICPGCKIIVTYNVRKGCYDAIDVQIVKFEILNDKCKECSSEKLYEMALNGIIKHYKLIIDPRLNNDYVEIWRVALGTCWTKWKYYIEDEKGVRIIEVYEKCDNAICCLQRVKVYIGKDSTYVIEPTGGVENKDNTCDRLTFENWENYKLNCFPVCEWLANYKGSTGKAPKKKDGASFKVDYENAYGINTGIEDKVIKVQIKTPKTGTAEVTVYDVSGKQVIKETAVITNGNTNTIMIGIAELQSGNYVYTVTIDGKKIESEKFNINR